MTGCVRCSRRGPSIGSGTSSRRCSGRGWTSSPGFDERFDRTARAHIPEGTDIYVGWSSFTEHGLGAARRLGAVTVVERGSSHIEYQHDILREEYQSQGVNAQLPAPAIVDKELREYEIADYISIPSEFAKRSFVERGIPGRKLLLNPYGVNLGQFRRLPKRDHVFRVVFAGAMSLQKGVHYLHQGVRRTEVGGAELWLIGRKLPEIEPYFRKYEGTFCYFGRCPAEGSCTSTTRSARCSRSARSRKAWRWS